jgi:crotonobetainyl-CoA:carnitine CoA-transferase CaiB-like acyl-CoA transferase
MSGGPLEGIRVVDFTQGWAGPFCTMELGDLGASVIKVEPQQGDFTRQLGPPYLAGQTLPYLAVNRSKRGIVLDLNKSMGVTIARRLASSADIVVESFDPGEADRFGIGYEALAAENPGLVYATVTAFGQSGPYRDRAASELVIQAMSGVLDAQTNGGPKVALGGDPVSLFTGKYLFHGILAALIYRRRRGIGQRVDVAMLEAGLARSMTLWPSVVSQPDDHAASIPPIWAGHDRSIQAGSQRVEFNFRKDGYTPNDDAWMSFFHDIGADELIGDPRVATEKDRTANFEHLRAVLEEHLTTWTADEVIDLVVKYGGMAAQWNDLEPALAHPQAEARGLVISVEHPTLGALRMTAPPYEFQGSPIVVELPPPTLGQHTLEILGELDFTHEEITGLVRDRVI